MAKRKGKKAVQTTEAETVRNRVAERNRAGLTSASAERLLKAGEDGYEHTETNVQRIIAAPLDRMWKVGLIVRREFEAGDQLRTDAWCAAIDPAAPSVQWGSVGGNFGPRNPSMFNSQTIATARLRWRDTERAIRGVVWVVLTLSLVKEIGAEEIGIAVFGRSDKREARAAGYAGIRVSLAALADHYRM